MAELSFLVFSDDEETARALQDLLSAADSVTVSGAVWDELQLPLALKKAEGAILYADLGENPNRTLDLLAGMDLPPGGFVVGGSREDSEVILRALRVGAREFLDASPSMEEISDLVEKLRADSARIGSSAKEDAQIIAVIGAKGGVGSTVVTCQLAASLQCLGQRTAILDLDYPLGDVAVHYDLHPKYTLSDVATASDQIDATLVGGLLETHPQTGVEVLAAPGRVEDSELVQPVHVEAVLDQLKERFDWIVLDVARTWGQVPISVLDRADAVILITLQDVPALNHARAYRDLLLRLGIPSSKVHTVVNRYEADSAIADEDFSRFLGAQADCALPNDYARINMGVNEGRSVAEVGPGSEIDLAFKKLAANCFEWVGRTLPESQTNHGRTPWRKRFFRKLGKKN